MKNQEIELLKEKIKKLVLQEMLQELTAAVPVEMVEQKPIIKNEVNRSMVAKRALAKIPKSVLKRRARKAAKQRKINQEIFADLERCAGISDDRILVPEGTYTKKKKSA